MELAGSNTGNVFNENWDYQDIFLSSVVTYTEDVNSVIILGALTGKILKVELSVSLKRTLQNIIICEYWILWKFKEFSATFLKVLRPKRPKTYHNKTFYRQLGNLNAVQNYNFLDFYVTTHA